MKFKKHTVLLGLIMGAFTIHAQTTNFSGTGNWSNAANWSNGIPTASTDVTTSIGRTPIVNGIGECNNLSLFLSSLTINPGATLTIHGQYNATTTGTNLNNGTLILKGTLKPAIGNVVLTLGGGGSVTSVSGLTFPTFTID